LCLDYRHEANANHAVTHFLSRFFALSNHKILDFTLVLITASIDFWIIKNIAGRKLVGMTWWMKINE
jgi:hypothetical protein